MRPAAGAEGERGPCEARYRALVETTGAGYVLLDRDGRILDANARYARIAGEGDVEHLRGRRLVEWVAPQDRARCEDALARCARGERIVEIALDHVDRQGRVTPVELSATAVEQEGGPRILSLCRDVSGRRQAETALIDAQVELMRREKLAVLGQLSGSLAHELRNPLGVIRNAAYFLETLAPGDPRVKEYLEIIKAEVQTSQRIISDLLDFSRTRSAHAQPVAVARLLRESVARCAVPGGVEVVEDLPESLPAVLVDPLQLRQVFQNLIANALQAMPAGGRLELRAARAGALAVEVAVADTGEGIPPEHVGKLFQPLFTTRARGIGLGLTVVKRNVEANGGTISVASAPGRGSTFTVRLPVAA